MFLLKIEKIKKMTKKENFVPEPLDKNRENITRHKNMTSATTAKCFGGSPEHENSDLRHDLRQLESGQCIKIINVRQKGVIYALAYTPVGGCYYGAFGNN